MSVYLFTSHDGFGLGHVRRNISIAEAVLRREPDSRVVVVTGVASDLPWLNRSDIEIVRVPMMVKTNGRYANESIGYDRAIYQRATIFASLIDTIRPDVVVVDRHPYGTAGELRPGLDRCRELGIATVLGLRDILDEAPVVWAEMASERWADVNLMYDQVLIYGARHICDHEVEYGLASRPSYVGFVTDGPPFTAFQDRVAVDDRLLIIAAGGGGDGGDVRHVGVELARTNSHWRAVMVAGPHSNIDDEDFHDGDLGGRLRVIRTADGCRSLLATAGASVQMAGYNTTIESLAAGIRPILVPRRTPRREQAIRAARFAALALADVVDDGADAGELSWLLNRPRRISPSSLADAGVELDGASRAATLIASMARHGSHRSTVSLAR